MKFLPSIILLLFFYQIGNCQVDSRLINYKRFSSEGVSDGLWKAYEKDITYDQNGNISFEKITYLIEVNGEAKTQGEFYEYNDNQLLKKHTSKRYNPDVDLWVTKFWMDYQYDLNNCLIQKTTTQNVGGNISSRVTYKRNTDCQILSELKEWSGNGFTFLPEDSTSKEYHADGISYDEKYFKYSWWGDSLYSTRLSKIIFNDNEMILEDHYTFLDEDQDTISHNKLYYEYDDFDNVTLMTSYKKGDNNEWQLNRKTHFYNEYDENDFLVYTQTERFNHLSGSPSENLSYNRAYYYTNSCEGLQKEYTVDYLIGNEYRYEFIYEGLNNCIDVDELNLQMTISPNPTFGEIEIQSSIFQTGNTDIVVYSIDGRVLLQKKEITQGEISTLDLSSLINGIYILQLRNGKHILNEKIVITK